MFIVEPLAAESTIRSPLGFMSLSTKWGNILFPGVTVLTTNFVQLSLLLHEYKKLKDEKKSNNSIKDILKSENTHRRLEKEWRRIRKEDDLVKTRMTYWNRYGSMFNYFQLDKNYKKLIRKTPIATAARLYKVVFQKNDTYSEKRKDARNRRIQHARRYSKIENWIQKSIDEKNYRALQWWVVGANHVEFADLPDLQLVRQLEFALSVWQTYFELCVSSYPQFRGLPLKPKQIKLAALVEKLILRDKQVATDESTKITKAESIENYDLARELLYIHQTYLKKKMPKWQKLVRKKYPTSADLVLLYDNRTTIADLSQFNPTKLFPFLLKIHLSYCKRQGKQHAELMKVSRNGGYKLKKLPKKAIHLEFSRNRCGLFGYRMSIAAHLFQSLGRLK